MPRFTYDSDGHFTCVHGCIDLKKNNKKVVRVPYLGGGDGFLVPLEVENLLD